MRILIFSLMVLTGTGIIIVWLKDIFSGIRIDRSNGFLKSRDIENGELLFPHLFAEFLTASGLIIGGAGLIFFPEWGNSISLISLGALLYTSLNSLSWALAKKERFTYAVPMIFGLIFSVFSIIVLMGDK